MSLDIQSVFTCAYFDRSHDGSSFAVCTGSPTDDEVPRKGSANLPRLALDGSVCLHSFRNLFESVMAQRLTDAFGPGAGAAPPPSTRPPWMHGIVVHGAQAHTAELFRALVLSAVGHALDVSTGDSRAQLQYSLARVYSWGVTDLLNQQRLAEFRQCDWDAEGLRRNVMIPGGGAKLESVLWDACAVPDGHAAVVCTLFVCLPNDISPSLFTIAIVPQSCKATGYFQKDLNAFWNTVTWRSCKQEKSNYLLRHIFPLYEVRSLSVIECLSADTEFSEELHQSYVYGCQDRLPSEEHLQPELWSLDALLCGVTPSQSYESPMNFEDSQRRERKPLAASATCVEWDHRAVAQCLDLSPLRAVAAEEKEEEKEKEAETEAELARRLTDLRAKVAAEEAKLCCLDERVRAASEEERALLQHVGILKETIVELQQARDVVESLLAHSTREFEKAAEMAEEAETAMLRRVDRAEEILRFSEADAVVREATAIDHVEGLMKSFDQITSYTRDVTCLRGCSSLSKTISSSLKFCDYFFLKKIDVVFTAYMSLIFPLGTLSSCE